MKLADSHFDIQLLERNQREQYKPTIVHWTAHAAQINTIDLCVVHGMDHERWRVQVVNINLMDVSVKHDGDSTFAIDLLIHTDKQRVRTVRRRLMCRRTPSPLRWGRRLSKPPAQVRRISPPILISVRCSLRRILCRNRLASKECW